MLYKKNESPKNRVNYYPYGSLQPGRNFNPDQYRFLFNGKEQDQEIKGVGNSYDYGKRMYDPRIGRPLSLDPIARQFPELSPYQFFSNNPIRFIDLDGLEGTDPPQNTGSTNIVVVREDQVITTVYLQLVAAAANVISIGKGFFQSPTTSPILVRQSFSVVAGESGVPFIKKDIVVQSKLGAVLDLVIEGGSLAASVPTGGQGPVLLQSAKPAAAQGIKTAVQQTKKALQAKRAASRSKVEAAKESLESIELRQQKLRKTGQGAMLPDISKTKQQFKTQTRRIRDLEGAIEDIDDL